MRRIIRNNRIARVYALRENRKLIRRFFEAFPTYASKDWESIYSKELSYIKDQNIQAIVLAALEYFADEMHKTASASSTGKYHPASDNGDGGLIRHTKTVVLELVKLINKYEHQGYGTKALNQNQEYMNDENGLSYDAPHFDKHSDPIFAHRDEMIAAAILHDMAKYPHGEEDQAKIDAQWNEDPEKYYRKPIMTSYTNRTYKTPVGGFEAYTDEDGNPSFIQSRGYWKCDTEHPPVGGWETVVDEKGEQCTQCKKPVVYSAMDHSKQMADMIKQVEALLPLTGYSEAIQNIAQFVEAHMGKWNHARGLDWDSPADIADDILSRCADMVSTADYVASHGFADYSFSQDGEIATNRDEYQRFKKDSIAADNAEEIAEIEDEIATMQKYINYRDTPIRQKKLARLQKYLKSLKGE